MDQNERSLLEEAVSLAKENNKILKQMRRSARIGKLMHLLYWIAIIAIGVVSYYLIQPYLQAASSAYDQARGQLEGLKDIPSLFER